MDDDGKQALTDRISRQAVDLADELWRLYGLGGNPAIAEKVGDLRPADIAHALERLEPDRRRMVFTAMPADQAAEVLEEVEPEFRDEFLDHTSDERLTEIVESASADDAVYFLDHLEEDRAQKVLETIDDEELQDQLTEQYELPDEAAGHLMTRDIVSFRPDTSVADIFTHLQQLDVPLEGYIYVTDLQDNYFGRVGLRDLVCADHTVTAAELMTDVNLSVRLDTDQEDVAQLMQTYHLRAIAVVDDRNRLCGQVTWDDAVDILEAEAEEDMLAIAGTSEDLEDNDPPLVRAWQRLPYLIVTAIGGFIMAKLIHGSTNDLSDQPILVAFLPMVMALAGNIGIQCATVTVRSIATGELTLNRVWGRSLREISTGLVLSVILSLICGLGALILVLWTGGQAILGGVIALSLLMSIAMAAGFGVFIPVGCQRLKIDPAIAAGPFVTMINDVSAVMIYLVVSAALLKLAVG